MNLRPATANDFNFIANSYLKSYRYGPETKHLISDIYFDVYKERLNHMIDTSQVLVACSPEDEDQILGYVIHGKAHGKSVLHYVYVKHFMRNTKIAKTLLSAAIPELGKSMVICTHTSRNFTEMRDKYKLIYNSDYAKPGANK